MSLEFNATTETASLHSPLEDFEEVSASIEVRTDPLTGRQTRLVDASFVMPEGEPKIEEMVENTDGCFFCPGMVSEATPMYADVDMERGSVGDAVSFPNLNPYGGHSNVVAITKEHYSSPAEFTEEELTNGLIAALEYIDAVQASNTKATYATINMNFLRPAGSSIIHPHMQTLIDGSGTTRHHSLENASATYQDETGSIYWSDLLDEEQDGPRYIGQTAGVDWIAPFAPIHHRHVRGILSDRPTADVEGLQGVGSGLTTILESYADAGLNSFNFVFFISPTTEELCPIIDVIGRSVFDQYYWSDSPFFTVLHDEGVIDVSPEEYAADLRSNF